MQWQKNLLVELIFSTPHRLLLTKSSSTSLTILSSPWRTKEYKKQRKGLLYSFPKKILFFRAEQYSVRSRLLKVLRSYVEDSNAGKGRAEGLRDELEKVSNTEILKKGKFLLMAKWWAWNGFVPWNIEKGKWSSMYRTQNTDFTCTSHPLPRLLVLWRLCPSASLCYPYQGAFSWGVGLPPLSPRTYVFMYYLYIV